MLPLSRNFTYGAGSPVRSEDLDDIQDCIIDGKHGTLTAWFAPIQPTLSIPPTNLSYLSGKVKATANVATAWGIAPPLFLPEGTTILGIKARAKGTGAAGTISITLEHWLGDGTHVDNLLQAVNPPAAYATYASVFDVAHQFTLGAGEALAFNFVLDLNNMELAAIGLQLART